MEHIFKVIADSLHIKESNLTMETVMEDIDTWDSLSHMELIVNLEKKFHLEFNGDEIAEMTTVGIICNIISKKQLES